MQISNSAILLGLLTALLISFSSVIDRYTTNKDKSTTQFWSITTHSSSFLIAVIAGIILGAFHPLPLKTVALLSFTGFLSFIAVELYYISITQDEDITRVLPITVGSQLIVIILAYILLGEVFSTFGYIGLFLIIGGVTMASSPSLRGDFYIDTRTLIPILSAIAFGLKDIFVKLAINTTNWSTVLLYHTFFAFLFSLIYVQSTKGIQNIDYSSLTENKLSISSEILSGFSNITRFLGYSVGFVTVVSSIAATFNIFTLIIVVLLGAIGIQIDKDTDKSDILWKGVGIGITLSGLGILLLA